MLFIGVILLMVVPPYVHMVNHLQRVSLGFEVMTISIMSVISLVMKRNCSANQLL